MTGNTQAILRKFVLRVNDKFGRYVAIACKVNGTEVTYEAAWQTQAEEIRHTKKVKAYLQTYTPFPFKFADLKSHGSIGGGLDLNRTAVGFDTQAMSRPSWQS